MCFVPHVRSFGHRDRHTLWEFQCELAVDIAEFEKEASPIAECGLAYLRKHLIYAPDCRARFSTTLANRRNPRFGLPGLRAIGLGRVTASNAACRRESRLAERLK